MRQATICEAIKSRHRWTLPLMVLLLTGCPAPDTMMNQPTSQRQYSDVEPYGSGRGLADFLHPNQYRQGYEQRRQQWEYNQAKIANVEAQTAAIQAQTAPQAQSAAAPAVTSDEQNCQRLGQLAADIAAMRDRQVPLRGLNDALWRPGAAPQGLLEVTTAMGTAIYARPTLSPQQARHDYEAYCLRVLVQENQRHPC
jgi:hypothetical protein